MYILWFFTLRLSDFMNYKNINLWIFVAGFFMSSDVMSITQKEIFENKKEECRQCQEKEYELLKVWKFQIDQTTQRSLSYWTDYAEYSRKYNEDHPFDFNIQRDFGSIRNFEQFCANWCAYTSEKIREQLLNHDSLDCKYAREKYERQVAYCNILKKEMNLESPENNE